MNVIKMVEIAMKNCNGKSNEKTRDTQQSNEITRDTQQSKNLSVTQSPRWRLITECPLQNAGVNRYTGLVT